MVCSYICCRAYRHVCTVCMCDVCVCVCMRVCMRACVHACMCMCELVWPSIHALTMWLSTFAAVRPFIFGRSHNLKPGSCLCVWCGVCMCVCACDACVCDVPMCLHNWCCHATRSVCHFTVPTGFKMSCMRSELLKEAAVMFVDPEWIISSHDVLKVIVKVCTS